MHEHTSRGAEQEIGERADAEGDESPVEGGGGGDRDTQAGEEKDVGGDAHGTFGDEGEGGEGEGPLEECGEAAGPGSV